jgi:hypothetical protein
MNNEVLSQESCNALGGHLASYHSAEEQLEVEQYFSNAGWLFPNYNGGYWLGLTNRTLPDGTTFDFQWLDPHSPGPDYSTYSGWGSSEFMQEPHDNGPCLIWLTLHCRSGLRLLAGAGSNRPRGPLASLQACTSRSAPSPRWSTSRTASGAG